MFNDIAKEYVKRHVGCPAGVRLRKAIQNDVRVLERRDFRAGQKTVSVTRRPPFPTISKATLKRLPVIQWPGDRPPARWM
jgi:hypothetical protein